MGRRSNPEEPLFHRGPVAVPGQRIGLLGGSFDPPHGGHLHISRWALRSLGLDRIWWLVSPGNPLKPVGPAEIGQRLEACRALIDHPRILATDIERELGTRYTADTLTRLNQHYPGVCFVWLIGSDNLASFHLWHRWEWILANWPVAVFARPGARAAAGLSPAALRFARQRLPQEAARLLGRGGAPRWALLTGPMSAASSTEIRTRGEWS
jgi:nicotinate-nucleotide adenylyltransferase